MKYAVAGIGACVILASLADVASAAKRRDGGYRWITVESRYGPQRISAPIRRDRFDHQVRLPGGTWIDCKQDCRQTLREETVDFWKRREELQPGGRR
jgi:hypothetical protein